MLAPIDMSGAPMLLLKSLRQKLTKPGNGCFARCLHAMRPFQFRSNNSLAAAARRAAKPRSGSTSGMGGYVAAVERPAKVVSWEAARRNEPRLTSLNSTQGPKRLKAELQPLGYRAVAA